MTVKRSLVCVHCGTVVGLAVREVRMESVASPLATHLAGVHAGLLGFGELPRWAVLLEHFRVVPLQAAVSPRVMQG